MQYKCRNVFVQFVANLFIFDIQSPTNGTSKHQLSYLDSVLRLRVSNIITKANASLDWGVESRVPGLDKVNVASVVRN